MVQLIARIVAYTLRSLAEAYSFYEGWNCFAGRGTVHDAVGGMFLLVIAYGFSKALMPTFEHVADHLMALSS